MPSHADISPDLILENFLQREMTMPVPSANFEFLRPKWNYLADFAGYAEQYAHTDPASALVKLRSFAEGMVAFLYSHHRLAKPMPQANLVEMLHNIAFKNAIPEVVRLKLDALRRNGNKAAHAEGNAEITQPQTALWILKESRDLAAWLAICHGGLSKEALPPYQEPVRPEAVAEAKLRRQREDFERLISAKEAEYQALLDQLAQVRQVATSAQELQQAAATGQQVALALAFSEAETRKHLIDTDLLLAGWPVGSHGASTEAVGQEIEVEGQPTASGKGRCDYVLYDPQSGRPLAVVEVKKTAKSPNDGLAQAKLYADALEKKHGQRPVIFTSNGFAMQIWNDAAGEPPRAIYGFYSLDSLRYLAARLSQAQSIKELTVNPDIAGRPYQVAAVRSVLETFAGKRRQALAVLATGTGKTRVAVSVCESMMRANWARRILFLCDRKELRKQARTAFQNHLPQAASVVVTANTYLERDHKIYFATYPAMRQLYESFDVGFFDLIIADESHRSIYGHYRELFEHFDACRLGLTATPRNIVSHDTYKFFGCEGGDPTAYYGYDDAIQDIPPSLVPYKVRAVSLGFIRDGLKYSEMTDEQKLQAEAQWKDDPALLEFDSQEVNRRIFNRDTNRLVLETLMNEGLRGPDGASVGKSIVFARSHEHAIILQRLFDDLYPQYGGDFASVIDHYEPRAEALLDAFKDAAKRPLIAISVDMLDTGVDVPEVVNLVFAKPVGSIVKFWQMVGRGTRLCKNLFGPGQDKTHFRIFDFWGNCECFLGPDAPDETPASPAKSPIERVFEARVQLADTALQAQNMPAFDQAIALLRADLKALPERSLPVRQKYQYLQTALKPGVLEAFSAETKAALRTELAPLMRWRGSDDRAEALRWDLLLTLAQETKIGGKASFTGLRDKAIEWLATLQANLLPVRQLLPLVEHAREASAWNQASFADLEEWRDRLRGIMHLVHVDGATSYPAYQTDITDRVMDVRDFDGGTRTYGMAAYKARVHQALTPLLDKDDALKKVRQGQTPTEAEITALVSKVLAQDPDLDLVHLADYYPESAGNLALALRFAVGLDANAVGSHLDGFIRAHPNLNATQIRFLSLLKQRLVQAKRISTGELYEAPFTNLASDGLDGVFNDAEAKDLCATLHPFLIEHP